MSADGTRDGAPERVLLRRRRGHRSRRSRPDGRHSAPERSSTTGSSPTDPAAVGVQRTPASGTRRSVLGEHDGTHSDATPTSWSRIGTWKHRRGPVAYYVDEVDEFQVIRRPEHPAHPRNTIVTTRWGVTGRVRVTYRVTYHDADGYVADQLRAHLLRRHGYDSDMTLSSTAPQRHGSTTSHALSQNTRQNSFPCGSARTIKSSAIRRSSTTVAPASSSRASSASRVLGDDIDDARRFLVTFGSRDQDEEEPRRARPGLRGRPSDRPISRGRGARCR